MSAPDPDGGQKYWFNGLPFDGVRNPDEETGGVKFWFNGLPADFLLPAEPAGTTPRMTFMNSSVAYTRTRVVF